MKIQAPLTSAVAGLLILTGGSVFAAEKKTAGKAPADYYIQVQRTGFDFQVFVNKVLVVEGSDAMSAFFLKITPFLKNGQNQISVIWEKVTGHETAFMFEVLEWPKGASRDKVKALVSFKPIAGIVKGEHEQRTFGFKADIPVTWSWESGRPIGRLSERDREAIAAILRGLHEDFTARDLDGVMRALNTAIGEMAFQKGQVLGRARKHYAKCMKGPGWSMEAAPSKTLKFKAYDKMVRVTAPGPVMAAVEVEGCGKIAFDAFYFSKSKQGWTLVRVS